MGSIPAHAGKTVLLSLASSSATVDPRSRGEDYPTKVLGESWPGRSPLTRGRRFGGMVGFTRYGSIPAHAGKTGSPRASRVPAMVDPRSRGEDIAASGRSRSSRGRSPLTRGRPPPIWGTNTFNGSIPAHAGKTGRPQQAERVREVDPRSRGEDRTPVAVLAQGHGRSPLTRGRRLHRWARDPRRRSIPAHAGKTLAHEVARADGLVDPRSRGEDRDLVRRQRGGGGRSPLTRGRHGIWLRRDYWLRSIPAHAGKTVSSHGRSRAIWVDPRSRGEDHARADERPMLQGRSPLTRGRLGRPIEEVSLARSIPAHAGKTMRRARRCLGHEVDPRSRGEDCRTRPTRPPSVGRSPLTRGRPGHQRVRGEVEGSIPAHAGKTPPWQ